MKTPRSTPPRASSPATTETAAAPGAEATASVLPPADAADADIADAVGITLDELIDWRHGGHELIVITADGRKLRLTASSDGSEVVS